MAGQYYEKLRLAIYRWLTEGEWGVVEVLELDIVST
jgi:hypothetical protein